MSAAPIATPIASATYHFFSSSLSSRATLGPLLLRGRRRRPFGREPARGSRVSRCRLERQEHFPAVGPLCAAILAQHAKDRLGKERALLQVLEIRGDGGRGQSLALHGDLVAGNLEVGEPDQVGKGLRDLV